MKKITLGLLISLFGLLIAITSYGASRLSEADACRIATATLKKDIIEENQDYNRATGKNFKDTYQKSSCASFESISDRGTAQIDVLYSCLVGEYNRTFNLKRKFFFIRTDQGWRIDFALRYNEQGNQWGDRKTYGR